MLAMSTNTVPSLSWVSWAVPIGAPLGLYMIAVAVATAFLTRCADEHATTTSARLNIRKRAGIFIFDSAREMRLLIPNPEFRPDDDGGAVTRARVLGRRAWSGIDFHPDD